MLSNRAVIHTRFLGPNQRGTIQFVDKFSSQTREANLKVGIQNSVIKYKKLYNYRAFLPNNLPD